MIPMTKLFPTIAITFLLFALPVAASPVQGPGADKDPYLTWNGPAYPWPNEALPALTLERRVLVNEDQCAIASMHLVGGGVDIGIESLGSFYIPNSPPPPPAGLEKSLIFYNSNVRSGIIAFTHFAKGTFFPDLDKDAVMGYAKALSEKSDPASGLTIEIPEGPSELPRKQMLLMCRPILLTWKTTSPGGKINRTRTDMFVRMNDGSLVVVSVLADSSSFSGIWAESVEMLRYSGFVKSGESPSEEK
jgi:hypothetical protein